MSPDNMNREIIDYRTDIDNSITDISNLRMAFIREVFAFDIFIGV